LAAEKEETIRTHQKVQPTIKVRVNGPSSVTYGASLVGLPDSVIVVTEDEYKSVKDLVTRVDSK
jgi:hypothetical protein